MQDRDFVWEHFKFNAEQRLRSFNFFGYPESGVGSGVGSRRRLRFENRIPLWVGDSSC